MLSLTLHLHTHSDYGTILSTIKVLSYIVVSLSASNGFSAVVKETPNMGNSPQQCIGKTLQWLLQCQGGRATPSLQKIQAAHCCLHSCQNIA